ncbi:MAG: hypothetical protein HDS50_03035, partial [Bacteroides sp.]|nr:hypothetical protein [Bacteroides sp.]
MKKLLLLLMAILLFAPPRANADEIRLHGKFANGNYAAWGNAISQPNSTTTNLTNSMTDGSKLAVAHNEGGYVCSASSFHGAGSVMVLPTTATSSFVNLVGIQAGNTFGASNKGYDRFQMLLEVPKGSSAIFHSTTSASDTRDIIVPEGSKIRFRTLGGTINSVKIELYNNLAVYGTLADAMKWTSDDATISTESDADHNYVIITVTKSDCKDFTVDMSPAGKPFAFTQINGDWNPITTVSKPEPIKYIWVNGEKKDIVDGKLELTVTDTPIFKVPITVGTSNVIMQRSAAEATAKTPALSTEADITRCFTTTTTTYLQYNATPSSNQFPLLYPSSGRTAANIIIDGTWQNTNKCLMPIYDSNAEMELPIAEGMQIKFVLRPHNWAGYGDPVEITLTRPTPTTKFTTLVPEIDADNLPEGCEWNAETKTYYYSKYDTDKSRTSRIAFKKMPFARSFSYSIDGSNVANGQTNPVVFDTDRPELPIILKTEPIPGWRTQYKVLFFDRSNNQTTGKTNVFEFFVEYRPTEGGGDNTGGVQLVQAPLVNEDEGQSLVTLAGDAVGFISEKVDVHFTSMAQKGQIQYQFIDVENNVWP